MFRIKQHIVTGVVVILALMMLAWVGYLTYQVYTFPTIASMLGDRDLVVVENNGKFYYIFSEVALEKPVTITDSKGRVHYLLSREKMISIGPNAIEDSLEKIQKVP